MITATSPRHTEVQQGQHVAPPIHPRRILSAMNDGVARLITAVEVATPSTGSWVKADETVRSERKRAYCVVTSAGSASLGRRCTTRAKWYQ